jgi:hypothetical protein
MFASIRCYFLHEGAIEELACRVADDFARLIEAQPGFLSYLLIDCGDREFATISLFAREEQALGSRELARAWAEQHLSGLEWTITGLHGEVTISRLRPEIADALRYGTRVYASTRSARLLRGSVAELMQAADEAYARRVRHLDGFLGYYAVDCGDGDVVAVSLSASRAAGESPTSSCGASCARSSPASTSSARS